MDNDFVDDDCARNVCKIGQGAACCRYLTMGASGWSCERKTELASVIDQRVISGTFTAKSINCDGRQARRAN